MTIHVNTVHYNLRDSDLYRMFKLPPSLTIWLTNLQAMDNIYVAIGYALGNSIMVIAPDGLIIVDVTESVTAAKEILKEFRKITDKPIKAIVYTHHHTDHIGGAQVGYHSVL